MTQMLACLSLFLLLGLSVCDGGSSARVADALPPTTSSINQSMAGTGTQPPSW